MATAIFLAGFVIAAAINPESVTPENGDYGLLPWVFIAFVCYDILSLRR